MGAGVPGGRIMTRRAQRQQLWRAFLLGANDREEVLCNGDCAIGPEPFRTALEEHRAGQSPVGAAGRRPTAR
jgi:hypothetical protein